MSTSERREAIRKIVEEIPVLPRIEGGEGARIELKIDITPFEISITGLTENHTQAKGAREIFDRDVEENSAFLVHFFAEVVAKGIRAVDRRSR